MEQSPVPASARTELFVRLLPWILLISSFGLRLVGIGWGLPNELHNQSYHPDEPINWAVSQRIEPLSGDFEPGFYNYGTLYFTLVRVASDGVSAYGGLPGPGDRAAAWHYMGTCILAGRLISAIAGAGTVLLIFLMLRKFVSPWTSSLGALWIGVAPAHVIHSRFMTADVLSVFLLAASLLFALNLLANQERVEDSKLALKTAALSGLFAGLSAGTKYTGALAILTLATCLFLALKGRAWKPLIGGLGAATVGFLAATPGALVNFAKFHEDFRYELQHSASGHGLVFVCRGSGFGEQLVNIAIGAGLLLLLMGITGLVAARGKEGRAVLGLAAFAIPYFVLIGRSEVLFLRYTFPLYPILAFGFGLIIQQASTQWKFGRFVVALGILALGGIDGAGLRLAAQSSLWMTSDDPRDQAAHYLRSELERQPGSKVGIVSDPWFYTPPLFPDSALPRPAFVSKMAEVFTEAEEAGMIRFIPPNPSERFDWDLRLLSEIDPAFVVISNFEMEDLERLKACKDLEPVVRLQVDRYSTFMERLTKGYTLAKVFGGGCPPVHDLEYVRPTIWVWKRK